MSKGILECYTQRRAHAFSSIETIQENLLKFHFFSAPPFLDQLQNGTWCGNFGICLD